MTMQDLYLKYAIHSKQISIWKSYFLSNASVVFEVKVANSKPAVDTEKLYKIIRHQKVEINFLKTVLEK